MSAAKMVADSTQADPDPGQVKPKKRKKKVKEKKTTKKNKTHDGKKNKTEKKGNDEDSDLDLEKELKAIGSYINSREEMINEMFHSLRGSTLQRHIPDVLKELPVEDLKARCLEQLEVMSKKRIRRILAGDDPANISSSGTEDESTEGEQDKDDGDEQGEREQTVDSTSCDPDAPKTQNAGEHLAESEEELEDVEAGSEEGEIRLRLQEGSPGEEAESLDSDNEEDDESRAEDIDTDQEEGQGHQEEDQGQDFSVNQMELLELEMRARAIKAMLKAQEEREKQLLEEG